MYKSSDIAAPDATTGSASSDARTAPPSTDLRAVATKVAVRPGSEARFAQWQSAYTRAISAMPGFVSLDIIPAFPGSADWQVIQRFGTAAALATWRRESGRAELLGALADLDGSGLPALAEEAAPDFHATTTVTEVISTLVEPGQETAFRDWAERIQEAQARFPGYMGTLVQAPPAPGAPWTTLVRFASPARLETWLGSAERQALISDAAPGVSTWKSHRMTDAFSGWFANERREAPPPAWKQTCLVLLVLFPVVMLEIRFLSPLLGGLPVAVSTFIGNALSVSVVSWPLMALAIAVLGWWLRPAAEKRWRTELLGTAAVVGLYAVELLVFTHVL